MRCKVRLTIRTLILILITASGDSFGQYSPGVDPQFDSAVYHGFLGSRKFDAGLEREAIAHFLKGLNHLDKKYHEFRATLYHGMGMCYRYLSRPDSAVVFYSKAIKENPQWITPRVDRGNMYIRLGREKKALRDYNKAIRINPGNASGHTERGNYFRLKGKFEKALDNVYLALEIDSSYGPAIELAGNILFEMRQFEKALPYYDKCIELLPYEAGYYALRGDIHYNLGNPRDEEQNYRKAVKVDDRSVLGLVSLAGWFMRSQLYDSAEYYYLRTIAVDDAGSPTAYGNLGWLAYLKDDFTRCISYSKKCIELDNESYYAMFNIALANLRLGQRDEAFTLYKKTKKIATASSTEGAINDLKDLLNNGVLPDETKHILKVIFKVTS